LLFILKNKNLQTVYCITGLGADEQIFRFLDLSFVKAVYLKWIEPLKNETLAHYALRLKHKYIHEPNPIIIGLSLGGMIASEIAKAMPSANVILISSAKTEDGIPYRLKLLRYIPLYKILPEILISKTLATQAYFLSAETERAKSYLREKMQKANIAFYKWAIGAIVNWQNKTVSNNIIHIHGQKDRLLPLKFVSADIIINKGGHLMIIENAAALSSLLKSIITKNIAADFKAVAMK
jgi:pimeloyl-ACP methyl ester carboxylesterase